MAIAARIARDPGDPASADLQSLLDRQRRAFLADGVPDLATRHARLARLKAILLAHREDFVAAAAADFGHRSRHETLLVDILTSLEAVKYASREVRGWMRPQRRRTSLNSLPARARVEFQPVGVVGVVAPWNYPVFLAFGPLAAALAAGNRVMLKPSEFTPRTSALLKSVLEAAFPPEELVVVLGGAETGVAFSGLAFDHLLFTGATAVGRQVMRAAAENLVPVTLELGGKSPVLVAPDASLEQAAAGIAVGKLMNAGQTCVAPDYALVPIAARDRFVDLVRAAVGRLYPTLRDNPDYSSIINRRHYERLRGLLDDAAAKGATLVELNPAGEQFAQQASHKIPPTLILDATDDMAVMQEEIFGPLLPVRTYGALDEALAYINGKPRPLALYLYSADKAIQRRVLDGTISGGVAINETMLQVAQDDLPFGGVGASGMGAYHGREGFESFSHKRAVFQQARLNFGFLARPPYGRAMEWLLRLLLR